MTTEAAPEGTRSVTRAIALLTYVCGHGQVTLGDAARVCGLSPTTALRLFRTLEQSGHVVRGEDGRYAPGTAMLQLSALTLRGQRLVPLARPAMERLGRSTGESVYLSVHNRDDTAVYIATVEGAHPVRHAGWVGQTIPLATSAVGAVFRGEDGAGGYAAVASGVEGDVSAIASPIRSDGRTLAALSVVGPSYRVAGDVVVTIGSALADETRALSSLLGSAPPDAAPSTSDPQ